MARLKADADQRLMTVPEAGALLGVQRCRAYELARMGIIPVVRLGPRRVVVVREAIERLIEGKPGPENRPR